jgi:hypothetical protein
MRVQIDRQHDEEDIGKYRGGINAKRDGRDIIPARDLGQAVSLPGIEDVAGKDGKRDGGKNLTRDELQRKTAERAQSGDKKQVRQAAGEECEKAVEIPRDKPFHWTWESRSWKVSLHDWIKVLATCVPHAAVSNSGRMAWHLAC